jgi:hypothetical protein
MVLGKRAGFVETTKNRFPSCGKMQLWNSAGNCMGALFGAILGAPPLRVREYLLFSIVCFRDLNDLATISIYAVYIISFLS